MDDMRCTYNIASSEMEQWNRYYKIILIILFCQNSIIAKNKNANAGNKRDL